MQSTFVRLLLVSDNRPTVFLVVDDKVVVVVRWFIVIEDQSLLVVGSY